MRKQSLIAQMCERQTREYEEMATAVDEQVIDISKRLSKLEMSIRIIRFALQFFFHELDP